MKIKEEHIRKANRKGMRDAELDGATGWKSIEKPHKNKKKYTRKKKHKNYE